VAADQSWTSSELSGNKQLTPKGSTFIFLPLLYHGWFRFENSCMGPV